MMLDELFLILPEAHASGWKCQIPMKDDNSFLEVFPVNSKILKIHDGNAIISLYLGAIAGAEIMADIKNLMDIEDPLSDAEYIATNEALCLEGTYILATREQLFEVLPELAGRELTGQDEEGVDVYQNKLIFSTWAR